MVKIKVCFLVVVLIYISVSSAYCLQQVVDASNLVQNIEQTLRTIRIESATMKQIAMKAKALKNDVTKIITLKNQLELAYLNIQNVRNLIRSGKYKSISELNQMCFAVQRVGYSVDGIERAVEKLFPESFDVYKHEKEKQRILRKQEIEISQAASSALTVQADALNKNNNDNMTLDIDLILARSNNAPGIKSTIQLQNQLITLLIKQNRELKNILATQARIQALEAKSSVSIDQKKRDEHKKFMEGWGETITDKEVLTDFP